jgi:N-acetylmuramoyl-L-alanine amidase
MSKKVYLSPSTQENNVGVSGYGTEENRMNQLCDLVITYLKKGQGDITIYRNKPNMTLAQVAIDSNNNNVDVHVALHSNAGGGDGTESYYFGGNPPSPESKHLATMLYNAVAPLTVAADNGVKSDRTLYSTGLYELGHTKAVAALTEIMYHDNVSDVNDYYTKMDQIAKAIAKAIYDYFGISYNEVTSNIVYRVITGSYNNLENAKLQVARLKEKGFDSFISFHK